MFMDNFAQMFLDVARKDLEAVRCLLHQRLYPQSIFYMQQAVEKATKSLALHLGIITETETRDIGHKTQLVYVKVLGGFTTTLKTLRNATQKFPGLKKLNFIGNLRNLNLNQIRDAQIPILNERRLWNRCFSYEEMRESVEELCRLKNEAEQALNKDKRSDLEDFKERLNDKLDEFLNALPPISANPEVKEKIKMELGEKLNPQLIEELLNSIIRLGFCCQSLLELSLIFSPHAIKSRYPERGFNPLNVYHEKMPLVRYLNSFIEILEAILENLDYIYKEHSKPKVIHLGVY
jgi:HEPN domain-containing protein